MRVATGHTVNLRFSSQFPLMAKVFADREAWTGEGGKQSYILPSHMESENELTLWIGEVKHVAIVFDHVHLKQTQGVHIPSSTLGLGHISVELPSDKIAVVYKNASL